MLYPLSYRRKSSRLSTPMKRCATPIPSHYRLNEITTQERQSGVVVVHTFKFAFTPFFLGRGREI